MIAKVCISMRAASPVGLPSGTAEMSTAMTNSAPIWRAWCTGIGADRPPSTYSRWPIRTGWNTAGTALEEHGFAPDLVVGTSAGSLVAALFASGRSGRELAAIADAMDETAFADWSYPGRGLIRGEALARFVRDKTNKRDIEQMKIPLGIAATDLDSGEGILFRSGDTGTAVRASSAVPAVFQPVRIGKREYVDGGLSAPIPVHHARQMGAEFVIAVDISAIPEGAPTGDAARMLLQTFAIMGKTLKNYELKDADVVLQPALAGVSGADFTTRRQSIKAGRDVTVAHLGELRERLAARARAAAQP